MLLYIIRHGDPIYDPDCLTELGHRQAEALVPRLTPLGFDKIFVSPMIRAKQTAEPTCKALGMTPEVKDFLSEEALFKKLSMMLPADEEDVPPHMRWCFHQQTTNYKPEYVAAAQQNWYEIPAFAPCRETAAPAYQNFVKEADEFLCSLGYRREGERYKIENPPYERVAVFCHQGVGLTWLSHMLAIPPQVFWASFDITHTGISVVEFKNYENGITAPKCLCLSDTSHLFGADLPLKYLGTMPF